MLTAWQKVFRDGLAPILSVKALAGLRDALEQDDPRLIHNHTTRPWDNHEAACEGGCLFGFVGMLEGLTTVDEVISFFGRVCQEIDTRCGEPQACRHLLRAWDMEPREAIRGAVLGEIKLALSSRGEA